MSAPAQMGAGADPDPYPDTSEYEDYQPERRLGPLAIIAMVVAVLAIAVGVFAIVTHGFKPKTQTAYKPAAVFKLQPGNCFTMTHNGLGVSVRPCSTPHESEVFAVFTLPGSSWPGVDAVQSQAESGCASRLSGYMNPSLAQGAFDQQSIYPDQVTWDAKVHTVVCTVTSSSGPITGSVRQAG